MRYMQIKNGQKLHLVYEPGEGVDMQHLVPKGHLGLPLCGRKLDNLDYKDGYRMTINVPLGYACKNCLKIYYARNNLINR